MSPVSTVRALKGYKLSCSVIGTPPIQTKMMWNSTMMANTTNVATIQLNKEGKYTCEASNQYGTDKKEFPVEFTGERCYLRQGFTRILLVKCWMRCYRIVGY